MNWETKLPEFNEGQQSLTLADTDQKAKAKILGHINKPLVLMVGGF